MKKKLSKYKILVDSISKTATFKIVLFLSFATAIYGVSLCNLIHDFFLSIIIPHSLSYFNIMVFVLLLVNTINNCNVVLKNYNYVIRLENRRNLAKNIVIVNLIVNIVWIIVFLLMFLSIIVFFRLEYISLYNMKAYDINILIYTIFYILRYYLYAILITTIFSLIYLKLKEKKTYLIGLLFICGFLFSNSNLDIVKNFQLLPWKYFEMINYTSFMTEVNYSLLYCIILEVIVLFLYNINQMKVKFRSQKLYFLINDVDCLVRNNKNILILFLFLPVICSTMCGGEGTNGTYIFQTVLGLNIEKNNPYILSVLLYLFNILGCAYVFIKSFIKDYSNVSNIYLRYNHKKFFIIKVINLSIILLILKLLQYELLYIVILILNGSCSNVINLFFKDLIFTLFLNSLFLLFYIIYKIFKKMRFLIYVVSFIFIYLFIIRQHNISEINLVYYLALFILEIGITNYILIKNNKKVIQEIGGV